MQLKVEVQFEPTLNPTGVYLRQNEYIKIPIKLIIDKTYFSASRLLEWKMHLILFPIRVWCTFLEQFAI